MLVADGQQYDDDQGSRFCRDMEVLGDKHLVSVAGTHGDSQSLIAYGGDIQTEPYAAETCPMRDSLEIAPFIFGHPNSHWSHDW